MNAIPGESVVFELPIAELESADLVSCSATLVPSRGGARPVVKLSPPPLADRAAVPIDLHHEARDRLRHVGGAALGAGLGIGLGILGTVIGHSFDGERHCNGGPCLGPAAGTGGYLGFVLGTGLGTAWAWNAGETEGALGGALKGSLLGGALGLGTALATHSDASLFLVVVGPGVGAWIGAALAHSHPKGSEESGDSLIVRTADGLSIAVPRLQLSTSATGSRALLSLVEGRF